MDVRPTSKQPVNPPRNLVTGSETANGLQNKMWRVFSTEEKLGRQVTPQSPDKASRFALKALHTNAPRWPR